MKKLYAPLFLLLMVLINPLYAQVQTTVVEIDSTFTGINRLMVTGVFCKVSIIPSTSDSLTFQGVLKTVNIEEKYAIHANINDSTLEIKLEYPTKAYSSRSGQLIFKVPANTNVEVVNTSGYVDFKNLTSGFMQAETKLGRISAKNLKTEVNFKTATGEINLTDIEAKITAKTTQGNHYYYNTIGELSAYSSSGKIFLTNCEGNIRTESTDGNQELETIKGEARIKTTSGNLKISIVTGQLNVISFSGPVKLFNIKGILNIKTSSGTQNGSRIIPTGNCKFVSTEGDVKMKLEIPKEQLSFMLTSERSIVFALGKTKKKKLKIGKGPILIEGSSTTGSQSYY